MRRDIVVEASADDRARLEAIVADRNSPQKHVWRAWIILLTAAAVSTAQLQEGALLLIDEVEGFLQDRRNAKRSWEVFRFPIPIRSTGPQARQELRGCKPGCGSAVVLRWTMESYRGRRQSSCPTGHAA
jgi:hypothetical protein